MVILLQTRNTTGILPVPKKAERVLDNTAPSNETAHRTSQTKFALCRQAVPILEKTGIFFF